jgi:YidC/Oxa1 family membrane protein insertase
LISTAILFLWSYLVPVKTPQQSPSPSSTASPQQTVTPPPAAENRPSPSKETSVAASPVEETPRRTLVVRTPLYQATFDSRGAGVSSWIIRKNKDSGLPISSVAGDKKNPVPLELVSPEGLKRGEAPLQLQTGESALDGILASSNYKIEGVSGAGDVELDLAGSEQKRVTFLLNDKPTGLNVIKTITFDADRYSTDLELTTNRNGMPRLPSMKTRTRPIGL